MRLELEADDEEQEHDTEFGERVDRFGLLDELESPRADRDAGEKVARDRAEPEAVRGHHRDHRGGVLVAAGERVAARQDLRALFALSYTGTALAAGGP